MPASQSTKRATGPTTSTGKSRSRLNAIKHGALSTQIILPGERSEEFLQLLDGLAQDLQPVGAMEQLLVQHIAIVLWRKRRLDMAETQAISSNQSRPVTDAELKNALHLDEDSLPSWMVEKFGGEPFIKKFFKPLPLWMRDEKNAPSQDQGKHAELLAAEVDQAFLSDHAVQTPALAQQHFPLHWHILTITMNVEEENDAAHYLQCQYGFEEFRKGFRKFMLKQQAYYYWVMYWHQNRTKMTEAFQSIRAARLQEEWEMERAHRYHTMLDRQLFRLLKEFREMREWRLSTLETAEVQDETNSRFAQ